MKLGSWCLCAALVLGCSSAESGDPGEASGGSAGATSAGQSGAGAAGAGVATAGSGGGVISAGSGGNDAGASGALTSAGNGGSSGGAGGASGASGSAGSSGNAGSGGSTPMGPPALRWIGRVATTANGARLSWPGTGFTARFSGTGAHVSLTTQGVDYFESVVDDKASVLTTQAGTHVYDLAKSLSAGDHTVTLWRRTEPNNGGVEVGALTFDGGALLPPPVAATKHLEIVGDSISVGFGVECKTIDEAFAYATEDNYVTYQALTARKLGAELFSEAWSGIGMWRDVGGSTTASSQMPARFLLDVPNGTGTANWDFAKYVPDAVVVLLGTNDFAKGDPGQPFVDAYDTFVAGLRTHYPKARQYYVVSPMVGGGNRTLLKGYLEQVVASRTAAKDSNVAILEFAQPASDAWGCGHPNAATHAIMAGVLEAALTKDLGW